MSLSDKHVAKPAASIGHIELVLNDLDGAAPNMSARGMAVVKAADGTILDTRYGDPQAFMPAAWKQKVKVVLDELRAEVATRLLAP